jgi:hypothetical protein
MVEPPFTPDKIHHSQDLNPPSLALRYWDVYGIPIGVDQKVGEPIALIRGEGSPNDMWPKHWKWCLPGGGTTTNSIKSATARMPYASYMIRRPEDPPQKALSRAKPNGRRNQGRPKSRWADGVNSDSLALGVRDWTHCAQDRQTWRFLLQQALTRYWL